jgi:quercetin dioxygenase-like cupin family protein
MPTINKPIALPSGDVIEILETSATTGGEYVRSRILFAVGGLRVPAHIHPHQDEEYKVVSGKLTYFLDGEKHIADAGTTITLPRGIRHEHYSEGPEAAVTIQTLKPGLDFDYLLENLFGLGAEGHLKGISYFLQLMVILAKMKSAFVLADIPIWLQKTVAKMVTPIAYVFGYRAVYERFSGEEW